MKLHCLYIVLFFFYITVTAQDYSFKKIGVNQGLPSSQVYSMHQAKNGYIWFATDRGLARYNGYEFEIFGKETGLPDQVILNIFPQENGDIWFSTLNHRIFYYKQDINEFQTYTYNDVINKHSKPANSNIVESIYVDKNSNVHLAFTTGGKMSFTSKLVIASNGKLQKITKIPPNDIAQNRYINCRKNNGISPYFYFNTTEDNSIDFQAKVNNYKNLRAAYLIKNDICAFINDGRVVLVNTKGEIIAEIKTDFTPLNVEVFDESHFMIGYRYGGAIIIDAFGNVTSRYLKSKSITNVLTDHQGGLWFSSLNSGVYYLKNPNLNLIEHPSKKRVSVNSLVKNNTNELYIGYDNGDVIRLNNKKQSTYLFHGVDRKPAEVSYASKDEQLYFFSNNKLYLNKNNVKSMFIRKFSEEQQEGLIITHLEGINSIENGVLGKYVKTIRKMRDACYWNNQLYVTTTNGLYSKYNDTIKKIAYNSTSIDNRIEDLDVNPWNNKLYAATLDKGLCILDKNSITYFTTKDGLLSNIINEVYIEDEQTVWLATNGGVNKIILNKDGNSIKNIFSLNNNDGLINNEVHDIEITNNTLWMGTKGGLMHMPKLLFTKKKDNESHFLTIKEVTVNESPVDLANLNTLSYDHNYLKFVVEGVSFKEDNNLTYYYLLTGLSDEWYETKSRAIRFSSLPPGKYTFKVTTCPKKAKCTKHLVEQTISIAPPFWKTTWFRSIILLLISAIIYLFFKVRILSYNRNVTRELIRLMIKRFSKKEHFVFFREAGQDVRIKSSDILYVKSSGNYIDVVTNDGQYTIRKKLSDFVSFTPDSLEYLRVHRMHIIRLDNVRSKSRYKIIMKDGSEIPVGRTYIKEVDKIVL